MPMAGLGSRFSRAGVQTPKPLVEVAGGRLFEWSLWGVLSSLAINRVALVVREPFAAEVSEVLATQSLEAEVLVLGSPTDGAATTVAEWIGQSNAPSGAPLVVADCDALTVLGEGSGTAFVSVAHSEEPAFSYVAATHDVVMDVVEKEPISTDAITGVYGFPSVDTFAASYAASRSALQRDEHYLTDVLRHAVGTGAHFVTRRALTFVPLGTPEQVLAARPHLETLGAPRDLGTLLR